MTSTQEVATEKYFFQKGFIDLNTALYIISKKNDIYYYLGIKNNKFGFYQRDDAVPVSFNVPVAYLETVPYFIQFVTNNDLFLEHNADGKLQVGTTLASFFSISTDGNRYNSIYVDNIYNMSTSGNNKQLKADYFESGGSTSSELPIENIIFIAQNNVYTTNDIKSPNNSLNTLNEFFNYTSNTGTIAQEYLQPSLAEFKVKKITKCTIGQECGDNNCFGYKDETLSNMKQYDVLNVIPSINQGLQPLALTIPTEVYYECQIDGNGKTSYKKIATVNNKELKLDNAGLWVGIALIIVAFFLFLCWIAIFKYFRLEDGKGKGVKVTILLFLTVITVLLLVLGALSIGFALSNENGWIISFAIAGAVIVITLLTEFIMLGTSYKRRGEEKPKLMTKKPVMK
jgi:hypothetical protein